MRGVRSYKLESMHISDFDYDLPEELIARYPANPRDSSRMMVLERSGQVVDSMFAELPRYLNRTDVLVINDTRVLRARTRARLERRNGTSRDMEVFFAEPIGDAANVWQVLCRPGRRIRSGDRAIFGDGKLEGVFEGSAGEELHVLRLESPEPIEQILELYGQIPLPPYIDRPGEFADRETYQTIYAHTSGAVAAPTAGLHFTNEILSQIRAKGISVVMITLHVGIGTFLPVRTDNVEEHFLRPERFEISEIAAEELEHARKEKRRIIAVGTTTTRTLEYLMMKHGRILAGTGKTDLYVLPGFRFNLVDVLLTNFHLPKSTLLMLVSAFAGREKIREAYQHAIRARYRFYSYGDCMFIER